MKIIENILYTVSLVCFFILMTIILARHFELFIMTEKRNLMFDIFLMFYLNCVSTTLLITNLKYRKCKRNFRNIGN